MKLRNSNNHRKEVTYRSLTVGTNRRQLGLFSTIKDLVVSQDVYREPFGRQTESDNRTSEERPSKRVQKVLQPTWMLTIQKQSG